MTLDQILAEVRAMLTEIIGAEYALGLDIGMDTSFDADLELESLEFVKLATKLTEHYGERVDFVVFLADKELEEIIGLTVGDVVTHIAGCLTFAGAVDG
ncbi:MAG TPA: acyl carrier protein [Pseudonocardiaceae bacterium]